MRASLLFLLAGVLYLAGLLPLLVADQGGRLHPRAYLLEFDPDSARRLASDTILNTAAFLPVGWLLARASGGLGATATTRVLVVAGFCGLFSLGVETLQFFLPLRYSSVLDVVANTGGALLGAVVAVVGWRGGRR